MAERTRTHKHSAGSSGTSTSGAAGKARHGYEESLRAGQQFQEAASQWWSRFFCQTGAPADWQKQISNFTNIANNAMPLAQSRLDDLIELMEKNGRTGAELARKAADAAQTPAVAECQAKWIDFWTSSLRAMQSNVEAVTEISTRAIDSWVEFVRRNTDMADTRSAAAA